MLVKDIIQYIIRPYTKITIVNYETWFPYVTNTRVRNIGEEFMDLEIVEIYTENDTIIIGALE